MIAVVDVVVLSSTSGAFVSQRKESAKKMESGEAHRTTLAARIDDYREVWAGQGWEGTCVNAA